MMAAAGHNQGAWPFTFLGRAFISD